MSKIIEINNISKQYFIKNNFFSTNKKNIVKAINNISFDVHENQTIGLIGLNGAGKSTLIKIILGILKVDEGEIKVFDNDPIKNRIKNLFDIGVIFGQKTQLRWDLSPLDSYKLNKELYNIDNTIFNENLKKYSDILDLHEFINRPVRTLSLGQKMRADLMSALLHKPKLLILDEPTIGVDIFSKRKIIDLIKDLKKSTTIIFTSHNLNEVYEIADKILILDKGNLVVNENKENLFKETDYLSLNLFLNDNLVYDYNKFKNIEVIKNNEYEYIFKFIPKNQLKNFIDFLYSSNKVNFFEIKENNLEKILKDITNEEI